MSKDVLNRLTKYEELVRAKLADPVSEKHKDHPQSIREFWQRELERVTKKKEAVLMAMPAKK